MIEQLKTIREAAWVLREHNRLHFGSDHNTIAEADKITSAAAQLEAMAGEQEPLGHYVYFPDQQRGEFAHDLDELCEDMTNDENHEVTNLYAAPVAQQQEPVAWQRRMRPAWGNGKAPWGPWEECSEGQAKDCWRTPLLHDWAYEARALCTAPVAHQPSKATLEKLRAWETNGELIDRAWQVLQSQEQEIMRLEKMLAEERAQQPQAEAVPDCGEAGHDEGCCGNRDCLPSARKKAPQQADVVRDAAAYHWLTTTLTSPEPWVVFQKAFGHMTEERPPTKAELDAAIYTAIAQQKGQP